MAYTTIHFKNPNSGELRQAPVGFSWTTLLFGCFPALFRGDWKWFSIQLLIALFTYGLSTFVFMFIYNKLYIKELINKGYKAASIEDGDFIKANSTLGISLPILEN
jgi:hypothetical protein